MARRLATVGWVGMLLAVLWGLGGAGEGSLAPPPLSPDGWVAWASHRTALEGAAAVLRLVAVAGAGYLLAMTVTGLVAALLDRRTALAVVARRSPPVVQWVVGAWLAGALAVGPATASSAGGPPPTMVLLPDDEPPARPAPPITPAPAVPPAPAAPAVATITLAPGDHLWSVAARTLATAWGRAPADREVAPYWRLLVELNRPQLPNPADPDLVFPGEAVRLPPVPR
jgi:hypothetical protein